jgi:hypothetical protein
VGVRIGRRSSLSRIWLDRASNPGTSLEHGRDGICRFRVFSSSSGEPFVVEESIIIRDGNGDPISDSPRGIPLLGDGEISSPTGM